MYTELHVDGKPLTYRGKIIAFDHPAERAMRKYGGFDRAERQGARVESLRVHDFARTHHVMEGWPSVIGLQARGLD